MRRREILKGLATVPLLARVAGIAAARPSARRTVIRRVRPADPGWPSPEQWARLKARVGGNLIPVRFPIDLLKRAPESAAAQTYRLEVQQHGRALKAKRSAAR